MMPIISTHIRPGASAHLVDLTLNKEEESNSETEAPINAPSSFRLCAPSISELLLPESLGVGALQPGPHPGSPREAAISSPHPTPFAPTPQHGTDTEASEKRLWEAPQLQREQSIFSSSASPLQAAMCREVLPHHQVQHCSPWPHSAGLHQVKSLTFHTADCWSMCLLPYLVQAEI